MKLLYWGNTVKYNVRIYQDEQPMDCTGLSCKLVLKEQDLRTASVVLSKSINWTNQSGGEGYFSISGTESEGLMVKKYYFEIILYDTNTGGDTFKKTLHKSILEVKQSLGLT